jgi:hypothetical protein
MLLPSAMRLKSCAELGRDLGLRLPGIALLALDRVALLLSLTRAWLSLGLPRVLLPLHLRRSGFPLRLRGRRLLLRPRRSLLCLSLRGSRVAGDDRSGGEKGQGEHSSQ